MAKVINITIDCTKIDKAKLYNGKYLDITAFISDNANDRNEWGMVVQSSKQNKPKGAILGNVKRVNQEMQQVLQGTVVAPQPTAATDTRITAEDLPF